MQARIGKPKNIYTYTDYVIRLFMANPLFDNRILYSGSIVTISVVLLLTLLFALLVVFVLVLVAAVLVVVS